MGSLQVFRFFFANGKRESDNVNKSYGLERKFAYRNYLRTSSDRRKNANKNFRAMGGCTIRITCSWSLRAKCSTELAQTERLFHTTSSVRLVRPFRLASVVRFTLPRYIKRISTILEQRKLKFGELRLILGSDGERTIYSHNFSLNKFRMLASCSPNPQKM